MNQIKITTADRMLRELGLIEFLFRLQLSDEYDNNPYITIIDGKGKRIKSRFMGCPFMLYSQTELFNIQRFKQEFTDRFETAKNTTLLINQAKKIREKASGVLQFVTNNWNDDNYKVKDFVKWNRNRDIDDEKHSAYVLVFDNLSINGVFYDRPMKLESITGSPDTYAFSYLTCNQTMVDVCRAVIDFVDKLFPTTPGKSLPDNALPSSNIQEFEYNSEKITAIHSFCNGTVFNDISSHQFGEYVAQANFRDLYEKEGTIKSKLKYIIYIISHSIDGEGWYKRAATSIGVTPSKCSGVNISNETWKKQANTLK